MAETDCDEESEMRMSGNYILVDGRPVLEPDILKWATWHQEAVSAFETSGMRVAKTEITADVYVSTVFLGVDFQFAQNGPPLLYESMVFRNARG